MAAPTVPTGVAWRRLVGFNMDISGVPVMGTRLLIRMNATNVTDSSSTPKSQIDEVPVEGQYGVDHILYDAAGNVGVWVVDPNTATLSTVGFNYQVTRIVPGIATNAVYNIDIPAGADGSDVDLADVTPVGANFGVPNIIGTGPAGPAGPAGATGSPGSGVNLLGRKANYASLPSSGNTENDAWSLDDTGHLWIWHGSSWVDAGLFRGADGTIVTAYQGAWDAGTAYSDGDIVVEDGSAWIATTATTGDTPSTDAGAHWDEFAAGGTDGTNGAAGATGSPGAAGAAATLAAGTATGLAYGATPTVTNVGTSSAAVFNFGIPAGRDGSIGSGNVDTVNGIAPDGSGNVTVPTGALRGTGMPNGVVTGSPGDEYIDTAFTNGARKWLKLTGTATNTGWVCVDGDTGWLAVALADATIAASFGGYLRRVGVWCEFYVAASGGGAGPSYADSGTKILYTLPVGFEPSVETGTNYRTISTGAYGNTDNAGLFVHSTYGIVGRTDTAVKWRRTGTYPPTSSTRWTTSSPWPTGTLPS